MKCPKCGYLGFEAVDRCRNCGYDFSLAPAAAAPELAIRHPSSSDHPEADLSPLASDLGRIVTPPRTPEVVTELPLFGDDHDDVPLITAARPPRPPLAVRRATPDPARLRTPTPRTPMLDLDDSEHAVAPVAPPAVARARASDQLAAPAPADTDTRPAPLTARLLAVVVDLMILAAVDAVVVYFTMQICGLNPSELAMLPKGPLAAFLLVQNGGYLIVFTAGGQTLGKMMAGIKVVPVRSNVRLDLGQAVLRTVLWATLAIPAGLGFLTTLLSGDGRGLHDRIAGTKVVRASA